MKALAEQIAELDDIETEHKVDSLFTWTLPRLHGCLPRLGLGPGLGMGTSGAQSQWYRSVRCTTVTPLRRIPSSRRSKFLAPIGSVFGSGRPV